MTIYRLHGGRCARLSGGSSWDAAACRSAPTPTGRTWRARSSSRATAPGASSPTRSSAPSSRATARCSARAGTRSSAARTPRSTRSRPAAWRRSARRDAVRVARAVLPRGQHAAVHRRDPRRPASAASSSPATTRPRRPPAAASASCATRASRSCSPTASSRTRARLLNQAFRKHARTGRPWVLFKSAMTLDGKVATRDRRLASGSRGEDSRELAHHWRASVDAVVVGIGTALADDPQLTARVEDARRVASRAASSSTRSRACRRTRSSSRAAPRCR